MKRSYRKQALWLVLPVLFVLLYVVFVEPDLVEPVPDVALVPDMPAETDTADPASSDEPAPPDGEALPLENAQRARDRAFISQAFPVLSSWDLAALKPLLAEQTLASTSDADFNEVITVLSSRLGELQSFDMPEPVEPAEALDPEKGSGSLQHYHFTARYKAGDAEVDLVVHQLPTTSKLYSFNITVPN